jgi:hypothetical protein
MFTNKSKLKRGDFHEANFTAFVDLQDCSSAWKKLGESFKRFVLQKTGPVTKLGAHECAVESKKIPCFREEVKRELNLFTVLFKHIKSRPTSCR